MKRLPLGILGLFFLTALFPSRLAAQNAEDILRGARMSPTSHPEELRAQIRGEGVPTPMTINLKSGVITYGFTNPEQKILLRVNSARNALSELSGGIEKPVSSAHLHDSIRDTGVTYEDLSLGFLYWPRPVLQGEDILRTRSSWKIDLQAPPGEPLYGVARVWIDKESGAILRIEGYDKKGLLLRRFEVISAQKIDGLWMLKQMRIESFKPGNPNPETRRYLEVLGKENG